ncbi:hypothetical protein D3C80_1251330 [compost metagenome]
MVTEQEGGHGGQVLLVEVHGAVVEHREHLVEHGALGAHAVLEEAAQVLVVPAACGQVVGQQAGGQVAVEHATGQALVLFHRARQAARGMALATVAQRFDHVLAALPGLALAVARCQLEVLGIQHVPASQAQAHIEREVQAGDRGGAVDRLHRLQVRVDGIDVFTRHQVIRGVGHGRIQVGAVAALALGHGGIELVRAVGADAVFLVRGDVGAIDGAERRDDRQAAGIGRAARGGVAGHAVGRAGQVLAAFDLVRVGSLGQQGRHGQAYRQGQAGN